MTGAEYDTVNRHALDQRLEGRGRVCLSMDASASFPPTSCAGGGIRKLLSRVLLRACLGTHVAAQSPFRAFARPAVPSRPVFTSPVSRASSELSGRPLAPPTVSLRPSCRPNRLPPPGACGYFPAGVPGVFAFPVRREDTIPTGKK